MIMYTVYKDVLAKFMLIDDVEVLIHINNYIHILLVILYIVLTLLF